MTATDVLQDLVERYELNPDVALELAGHLCHLAGGDGRGVYAIGHHPDELYKPVAIVVEYGLATALDKFLNSPVTRMVSPEYRPFLEVFRASLGAALNGTP